MACLFLFLVVVSFSRSWWWRPLITRYKRTLRVLADIKQFKNHLLQQLTQTSCRHRLFFLLVRVWWREEWRHPHTQSKWVAPANCLLAVLCGSSWERSVCPRATRYLRLTESYCACARLTSKHWLIYCLHFKLFGNRLAVTDLQYIVGSRRGTVQFRTELTNRKGRVWEPSRWFAGD